MHLLDAEAKLRERLYQWASVTMSREVAEDFPALRACQHSSRVKCFLAWMEDMPSAERLPTCIALVKRHNQLHLTVERRSPEVEAVFEEYGRAYSRYHDVLPPVSDCDRRAPRFVSADPERCLDEIVQSLSPLCGKPRKSQKLKRRFTRRFGDWVFTTYVQIWLRDERVHCHGFLQRSDCEQGKSHEEWSSRIDPLMHLGVASSTFPLVGKTHEALCAQSLRAALEMFVPSIPKLIQGLEVSE